MGIALVQTDENSDENALIAVADGFAGKEAVVKSLNALSQAENYKDRNSLFDYLASGEEIPTSLADLLQKWAESDKSFKTLAMNATVFMRPVANYLRRGNAIFNNEVYRGIAMDAKANYPNKYLGFLTGEPEYDYAYVDALHDILANFPQWKDGKQCHGDAILAPQTFRNNTASLKDGTNGFGPYYTGTEEALGSNPAPGLRINDALLLSYKSMGIDTDTTPVNLCMEKADAGAPKATRVLDCRCEGVLSILGTRLQNLATDCKITPQTDPFLFEFFKAEFLAADTPTTAKKVTLIEAYDFYPKTSGSTSDDVKDAQGNVISTGLQDGLLPGLAVPSDNKLNPKNCDQYPPSSYGFD